MGIAKVMSVWALSVPGRQPLPSVGPSSWPSSPLSPHGEAAASSSPQRQRAQQDAADGQYFQLLQLCQGCTVPAAASPRPPLMPPPSSLASGLWEEAVFTKSVDQELTGHLVKMHIRVSMQRTQASAVATIVFTQEKPK